MPSLNSNRKSQSELLSPTLKSCPQLRFSRNPGESFDIPLSRPRLRIGRGPACDLRLPDPEVSRLHVLLERRGTTVFVADQSRNGTGLNGELLSGQRRPMRPGDRLEIGGWTAELMKGPGSCQVLDDETIRVSLSPCSPPSTKSSRRSSRTQEARGARLQPNQLGLVGGSTAMQDLRARILEIAPHPVPVLITGETGCGKERVAQAIHKAAFSQARPFCPLNCGAIHKQTAASTLFGHERGAFTGAQTSHQGIFAQAQGGTVFLDEIGELPLDLQATLLRVLETHEVRPLGGSKTLPVAFRLIAATHRDLREEVRKGRFREDLYYRLGVVHLQLAPLRARPDDILPLAEHLLATSPIDQPPALSPSAIRALATQRWPGNVRELRNVLLRSLIGHEGPILEASSLRMSTSLQNSVSQPVGPARLSQHASAESEGPFHDGATLPFPPARPSPAAQRHEIVEALTLHCGNRRAAASSLGIARSTLYARMHRLGLREEAEDPL